MSARFSAMVFAAGAACIALCLVAGGCGKEGGTPPAAASSTQAAQAYVNDKCPIMSNNPIDPAKVTPDLVREYKGQKVAFCCGMCPPQWDKLTDADKDAKLAKVMKK